MADIQNLLKQLMTAVYGKDVRQAIVDSIKQCYNDASKGLVPVVTTKKVEQGVEITITVGTVVEKFVLVDGYIPVKGTDYWTDKDKREVQDEVYQLTQELEDLIEQTALSQTFVDSVDEMTDINKRYVLKSTGTVWEYRSTTIEQEITITDEIVATTDNPYNDNVRFGSSGDVSTQSGYVVTPYIDLTKEEYQGKTIEIHLEGAKYAFNTAPHENYIMTQLRDPNKNILSARTYTAVPVDGLTTNNLVAITDGIDVTINGDTSAVLTITVPASINSQVTVDVIGYIRCCGLGASTNSSISIIYRDTQTIVAGGEWFNTEIPFGYILGDINNDIPDKISRLDNDGVDPTIIKLLSLPVLEFYSSIDYPDNDYTITHLSKRTYPCRADIPIPFMVKWNHNENAMRTTLVVDTKAIGTLNNYSMRIYDVTGFDNYPIYNLLPDTTYFYKVTHILSDGSLVEAKNGSFKTSDESIRLIYIDGTQNVRDLGGWTGLDGRKVKYGKIFRGAAFSDSSFNGLMLTGKGRLSLAELRVQAELNLGSADTKTEIAQTCAYKKIGYANYATAITNEIYKAQFKEVLEYIVSCLNGTYAESGLPTVERNIYMHCQGGCDRTGTLSFQLLGLLGVSESDLAKEYELSSFSDIGFGRLRTTTKEVNTYDYVGMVEALKTYSGNTITDKFYNFAIDCGISADTITTFRNLMLE